MITPITQLEQLTLNSSSKQFLRETAKWTFFLAILGFIFIGLLLLFAIFTSTIFSMKQYMKVGQLPVNLEYILTATYFVLAVVYFFPLYYLLQFSNKMKKALASKNDNTLAIAFKMLKSHYKFIGVFSIITISLYILLIVVAFLRLI